MLAVYLLLGFFIGSQASRKMRKVNVDKKTDEQQTKDNTSDTKSDGNLDSHNPGKHHRIRIKQKMKKFLPVKSNSPEGINPEKVSINIRQKGKERNKSSPKEPSFIALTVLWAHFVAKQLGVLNDEYPSPWQLAFSNEQGEVFEKKAKVDISRNSWRNFLGNIIKDNKWTTWIKDPGEVRRRTFLAFES